MAIGSISGSGLQGINTGLNIVNDAADRIAKQSGVQGGAGDLATSAVDLLRGRTQVEASSKVLETENQIIGSLIDIEV